MYLEYCVLRRVGDSNMYYCCQVGVAYCSLSFRKIRYSLGNFRWKISKRLNVMLDRKVEVSGVYNGYRLILHEILCYLGKSDSCDASELFRRDQLYDFWVILTIDDNIKLQFCQRY